MKTIPLDELLKQITPLPYSPDDGLIRLSEQLEFCRENIGTDQEWQSLTIHDNEGPAAVVALCHPQNAAYLAHAANLLPELVTTLTTCRNSIRHAAHCRAPQAYRCTCDADRLWELTQAVLNKATAVPVP